MNLLKNPTWKFCENSGNNIAFTDANGNEFYYSYQTLIAFRYKGKLYIRQNNWNVTTGKHLNAIDGDKSKRIEGGVFEDIYYRIFEDKYRCYFGGYVNNGDPRCGGAEKIRCEALQECVVLNKPITDLL